MSSGGPNEEDPLLSREQNTDENAPNRSSTLTSTTNPPLRPTEISKFARWGVLAGVWSATFLSALNSTLVPTMLPSISSEFQRFNEAGWIGTAYLLSTCTFTPLYGRLCDILGRRGANRLALILTGAGVLGCGLSTTMEMLVFSRFISGIGGGGLWTTSSVIVSDMYNIRQRAAVQGVASVFNSIGAGLGGPLGGFITDRFGWRWAFLLQMPLFLGSFLLTSFHLKYIVPGKGKSTREVLERIDWGGCLTLFTTVSSLLIFLSARYNEGLPLSNPTIIASIYMGCFSAIAFVITELRIAREPILAPFLLKKKIPILVGMCTFFAIQCNFTITFFFPIWFQTVVLTSAATAGMHLVPNSVGLTLGTVFAGYMIHRTGRYKMINLIFGWLPFSGAVMIATLHRTSPPFLTWMSNAPLGFGTGVLVQTIVIALLATLPSSQVGVASGFGAIFRGIGQICGVAVSAAIFQFDLDAGLRRRITGPDAEEIIKKIRLSSKVVASLPLKVQAAARDSYEESLRKVFVLAACSAGFAFLVGALIPDKDLDEHHSVQDAQPGSVTTASESSSSAPGSRVAIAGSDSQSSDVTDH